MSVGREARSLFTVSSILVKIDRRSLKNTGNFSVVTAPSGEGAMSPSCSKMRNEYLTLCWGTFSCSESLIMPIGSCSMIALSMVTWRSRSSISLSILLVNMLLPFTQSPHVTICRGHDSVRRLNSLLTSIAPGNSLASTVTIPVAYPRVRPRTSLHNHFLRTAVIVTIMATRKESANTIDSGHLANRAFWILSGTALVMIGAIALLIPLIPTTPFLLLGAACYAKLASET